MPIEDKIPGAGAMTGETIGGFRVVSLVERDADGVVTFRVLAEEGGEHCTLRIAPAGSPAELTSRFLRDARLLAGLDHPSLASVRDLGESPEGAYVVTDEARARSLTSVIDGGLSPRQTIRMHREVAEALDVAHGAGLLHRQLRPANVVVGEWLIVRPLLVNFALGRAGDGTEALHVEQAPYLSPEELRGEEAGPRADHYALAATLFEFIVGEPPFGRSKDAAVRGHLDDPPPRLTGSLPGLEPAVDAVFERALAKDPDERYASAAELVAEVTRALTAGESSGGRPGGHRAGAAAIADPETPALGAGAESDPHGDPGAEPASDRAPDPLIEPEPRPEVKPAPATESGPGVDAGWEPSAAQEAPFFSSQPRRPPGPRASRGASLAVVVGAAILGLLLGRAGADDHKGPGLRTAADGALSLKVPDHWTRSASIPRIGGLRVERPLAITRGSATGILAGVVRSPRAALDPRSVAEQVGKAPPRATVVRLGRLEAYRWQGLDAGAPIGRVDLFVAPTSAGALTVACYGPGARAGAPSACHGVAGSVRLARARGYSPVQAARWRESLRLAIDRLRAGRAPGLTRLEGATSGEARAREAAALARLHAMAAGELSAKPAPPQAAGARRQIVDALRALDRAYGDLARTGRNLDLTAYAAAWETMRRQDERLRRALGSV